MIDIKQNRRFFLKSSAGMLLTIPTLTSLMSEAQTNNLTVTPRLVTMNMSNGGLLHSNWYPENTDFGAEIPLYSGEGHFIRESPVLLNDGKISTVFDSKFAKYASNMNFYKGMDVMFDMVHHGGWLGQFRACNVHDLTPSLKHYPTIDSVVGYMRDANLLKRTMILTSGKWRNNHYSYVWTGDVKNPTKVEKADAQKLHLLFDTLFTGDSGVAQPLDTEKILAVDSVLESFNRVVNGSFGVGRRISSQDSVKLSEHMEKIFEIETRLNEITNSCSKDTNIDNIDAVANRFITGKGTSGETNTKINYQVFTDIIAEAFSCDVNRVATIDSSLSGTLFSPTNYHDFTHNMHNRARDQEIGISYKKFTLDNVLFPLLEKLSAKMDVNGKSILDNSLVCMFDESGQKSHFNDSTPVVTFGSANGYFKTGKYVDYRHPSTEYRNATYGTLAGSHSIRHGVPWNRFLATILQSMGLPPSVWERAEHKGYGENYISGTPRSGLGSFDAPDYRSCYEYQLNDMSKSLPLVTT